MLQAFVGLAGGFMGLKEDVLAGIGEVLGDASAEHVIKTFDDPKKYPKDFLDAYLRFMQNLIGSEAQRKVEPLYKKYGIKHEFGMKLSLPA